MISAFILFIGGTSMDTEEKIVINQNFPAAIMPGDEFIVTVKIHKSAINGFARFQHDLPAGFTAVEMENSGADFLFEDQHVKFIWVKLPVENDFSITYKIKTNKKINGNQIINGVFVYMDNDKTQRQNLESVTIKIEENAVAALPAPQISRRLLSIAPDKGEYRVELTIRPNRINESAQFTDSIPENYTALLIDAHDAIFSFENHSAIFKWATLPSDSSFKISYTVKSDKASPSPVINGVFVYGNVKTEQPVMKEDPISENFLMDSAAETKVEIKTIETNTTMADTKTVIAEKKLFPAAENGIVYKVQISATKKSSVKNNEWFTSKYQINSNVELTYHEGWKKYLIGSFQAYKEASNLKKQTQEKISDAFIVAYENGIRIPISEARQNKSFNQ